MFQTDAAPSAVNETTLARFRSAPSWTPDRLALLKAYYEADLTFTEIAERLGTTRGAIAGKLDRIGLERRPPRPRLPEEERRRRRNECAKRCRQKNPEKYREHSRRYYLSHSVEVARRNRAFRAKMRAMQIADAKVRITDLRTLPTETIAQERVHICDLTDNHCRWPYEGLMFCGKQKAHGAYCEHHAQRAYFSYAGGGDGSSSINVQQPSEIRTFSGEPSPCASFTEAA